jgi:hypothetical protein
MLARVLTRSGMPSLRGRRCRGRRDGAGIAEVAADHGPVAQHHQLVGDPLRVRDADLIEEILDGVPEPSPPGSPGTPASAS